MLNIGKKEPKSSIEIYDLGTIVSIATIDKNITVEYVIFGYSDDRNALWQKRDLIFKSFSYIYNTLYFRFRLSDGLLFSFLCIQYKYNTGKWRTYNVFIVIILFFIFFISVYIIVGILANQSSPIRVSQLHYMDEYLDMDLDNKKYPRIKFRSV